jgi:hypothetical protein
MKVEVAIGEVFDKITILDIKLERISDEDRLSFVRKEKDTLEKALNEEDLKIDPFLYSELRDVNMKIWDTEAGFREKESKQEFDAEFVEFARLNAKYNDERFLTKKRINEFYECEIREQKSYDRLYNSD